MAGKQNIFWKHASQRTMDEDAAHGISENQIEVC